MGFRVVAQRSVHFVTASRLSLSLSCFPHILCPMLLHLCYPSNHQQINTLSNTAVNITAQPEQPSTVSDSSCQQPSACQASSALPTHIHTTEQHETTMKTLSIILAVMLLLSCMAIQADAGLYDIVAKGCAGAKRVTGWGCDDKVSRGAWRLGQRLRGVKDCPSLCRKQGKRGGRCQRQGRGYKDRSTWCPAGQTCRCH